MAQDTDMSVLEASLDRQYSECEHLLDVIREHVGETDDGDVPDFVMEARHRLCGFWDRCVDCCHFPANVKVKCQAVLVGDA
jgi:hypothetical protein